MANVKISALPSYTGSAADLRWFVMNDSGETTTYKYSGYTSPFKVENYAQASIFSIFGTPAVYDADCVGSVVIGSEAAAYDDYTTLIGWKAIGNNDIEGRCTAVGADAQATARFSTAYGMSSRATGFNSTAVGHNATASATDSVALGHTATASASSSIAIGKGITCANELSIFIGNLNLSMGASSAPYCTLLGGNDNAITSKHNGKGYGTIIAGGSGNRIGGNSDSTANYLPAIIGGTTNENNAYSSGIFSARESIIRYGSDTNNGVQMATITGGFRNIIRNLGLQSGIVGGIDNVVEQANSGVFGGDSNQILDAGTVYASAYKNSAIIGGQNNTINQLSNTIMLGCSGRTATTSATTYVENLKVFGSFKGQVGFGNYNNGNQGTSYQIDWSNGNIQKIVLTANTTFSATNITNGTTYIFKVQQDGTGNRTGTWTSSQFKFPNSTPPTLSTGANAVDIFTFVAMDGVLYGVAQLNFG